MQHSENYQTVLVSKTLFKRMVNQHALCSQCLMPADLHGGYKPCPGAHLIIDMEIINAVATKTPEPDRRPTNEPTNDGPKFGGGIQRPYCAHGHITGTPCIKCETPCEIHGVRLRE